MRMLLDLAEHRTNGFISLKEIADRQNISKQYLEQIIIIFNNSKFLRANRGVHGGYILAKDPSDITVGHILRITEGNLSSIACLDSDVNQCKMADTCKTLYMWKGLNKVIADYLDSVTLQDILNNYHEQQIDNYVI